jgi:hypothetical protein
MGVLRFEAVPFAGSEKNRATAIPLCGISDRASLESVTLAGWP